MRKTHKFIGIVFVLAFILFFAFHIFQKFQVYNQYIFIGPLVWYRLGTEMGPFTKFTSTTGLSFEVLSEQYAKDKRNVYFQSQKLEGADLKSFEVLDWNYARDKNKLYYQNKPLNQIDPRTVRVFPLYKGIIDKNAVYEYDSADRLSPISGANPKTFEFIGFRHGKDDQHVYYKSSVIPGADPNTYEIIGERYSYYSRDENNVYKIERKCSVGVEIIEGVDKNSFEPVLNEQGFDNEYAKDKDHVYHYDFKLCKLVIMENVDPNTFEIIEPEFYYKDKNSVFKDGGGELKRLPNEDPKTFISPI